MFMLCMHYYNFLKRKGKNYQGKSNGWLSGLGAKNCDIVRGPATSLQSGRTDFEERREKLCLEVQNNFRGSKEN